MKKAIVLVVLVVMILTCLAGCREEVSREPVDARFVEEHTKTIRVPVPIHAGKFTMVQYFPRTIRYPDRWEIKWLIHYDDGSSNVEWIECSEAEYESFLGEK